MTGHPGRKRKNVRRVIVPKKLLVQLLKLAIVRDQGRKRQTADHVLRKCSGKLSQKALLRRGQAKFAGRALNKNGTVTG